MSSTCNPYFLSLHASSSPFDENQIHFPFQEGCSLLEVNETFPESPSDLAMAESGARRLPFARVPKLTIPSLGSVSLLRTGGLCNRHGETLFIARVHPISRVSTVDVPRPSRGQRGAWDRGEAGSQVSLITRQGMIDPIHPQRLT